MAKKGGKGGGDAAAVEGGGGSKKAQGQARKAEAANKKVAAESAKLAAAEDAEWDKGAKKGNAKKEAAEAKAAEAARKKAERDALLAEEDKSLPSRPGPKNAKTAVKKTRGLDLSSLDEALPALNASGIDNAVDALDAVEGSSKVKVSKGGKGVGNLKIAYQEFEDRMKAELTADGYYGGQTGKTKGHAERIIAAAWAKHPDNPKNQGVHVAYNATKEEIAKAKADHAAGIEARLGA